MFPEPYILQEDLLKNQNWPKKPMKKAIGWAAIKQDFLFYFSQIYNLLYNGAISKYVVRKHLCGAIIQ
jgi:hypothetical protein